jgi:hypothetical protein
MDLQALKNKIKELEEEVERLEQPQGVWLPKEGDNYWLLTDGPRSTCSTHTNHRIDLYRIENHNVYQSEALRDKARIMQRQFNMIAQVCLNFDPDFEPDMRDEYQAKYGFYYDPIKNEWETQYTWTVEMGGAYVSTPAIADKVVAYLNSQEIK